MAEKGLGPFVLLGFLAVIGGVVGHSGSSAPTPAPPAMSAAPANAQATTSEPLPLSVDEIKELQNRLNTLGFNAGLADGIVGPQTQAAVVRYEAERGGTQTGRVDRQLLGRLRTERSLLPQ